MGHLISDPTFKIPTSPCPLCEFLTTPLGRALNIQQICQKKDKYNKNNLKAVFCLLELLVYIQLVTWPPLSCNAQFSYWVHYLPFSSKIFENMLHLSFSMKLTFSARKYHWNGVAKSTELVDIIGFAWNKALAMNTHMSYLNGNWLWIVLKEHGRFVYICRKNCFSI